jgi:Protein of unknown function (DUF2845)
MKARSSSSSVRLAIGAIAVWLAVAAGTAQADGMRCGSKIIRDGDSRDAVLAKCGEPTDVQQHTILRRPYFDFAGRIVYYGDGLVEVPVEIWTYNFGPYKLMRRIRLVDGLVEDIETLGYGYLDAPG